MKNANNNNSERMTTSEYNQVRGLKRYTVGMSRADGERAMQEWWYRQAPCAVKLCRAKTPGWVCLIVEADAEAQADNLAIYWLAWVQSYFPEAKMDVRDIEKTNIKN